MTDQHPADDQLVALALDEISEPERDRLTGHLSACASCRGEYDAVASAVEQVLAATPWVQPRPGFDRRALEAMGLADAPVPVRPVTVRRASPRRRWAVALGALAAALAAGVLIGVAGTMAINPVDDAPGDDTPAGVATGDGAPLVTTADNKSIGSVARSWVQDQPVLVITVGSGPAGVHYDCVLERADGSREIVAEWTLDSAEGATWVVEDPGGDVVRLELVTDQGNVWSSASL